jgi:hypothetical protein
MKIKSEQTGLSISALSENLSVDRATMAKAIRKAGISPVSHDHVGHPRYDLEEATDALYASLPPLQPMTEREKMESMITLSQHLYYALEHMAEHGGSIGDAMEAGVARRKREKQG